MKLVKEILYEKFTEESDPVQDMGLGISHYIEQIKQDIINKHMHAARFNPYGYSKSSKELARITSPQNITKYTAYNYFHYGVDIAIGVINYFLTNKNINQSQLTLIHSALSRGRSIKNRHKFIEGLVNIGIRVKQLDVDYSMSTKDDKMTRFLVESAIQQKKPKLLKRLLDSALKHAIRHKKVDMILWLFKKGADPAYNKYETLRWALVNDEKELAKEVLKHINNDPEYK